MEDSKFFRMYDKIMIVPDTAEAVIRGTGTFLKDTWKNHEWARDDRAKERSARKDARMLESGKAHIGLNQRGLGRDHYLVEKVHRCPKDVCSTCKSSAEWMEKYPDTRIIKLDEL